MTPWLSWFLACLLRAMQGADVTLAGVLDKAQFWQRWASAHPTPRCVTSTTCWRAVFCASWKVAGAVQGMRWN